MTHRAGPNAGGSPESALVKNRAFHGLCYPPACLILLLGRASSASRPRRKGKSGSFYWSVPASTRRLRRLASGRPRFSGSGLKWALSNARPRREAVCARRARGRAAGPGGSNLGREDLARGARDVGRRRNCARERFQRHGSGSRSVDRGAFLRRCLFPSWIGTEDARISPCAIAAVGTAATATPLRVNAALTAGANVFR
jgi:hypothetical protein